MKKQFFTICLATILSANIFAQDWEEVGGSEDSPNVSEAGSFTLTTDGKVYIAYSDGASNLSQRLSVKEFDGTKWKYVGQPGESSQGKIYNTSIVSLNGTLYMAYRDYMQKDQSFVKRFNNDKWEQVGQPSTEYSKGNQLAVCNGSLYWACKERAKLVVRKLEGSEFKETTPVPFAKERSPDLFDMVVNNNQLFVAYTKSDDYSRQAQLIKLTADNKWENVGPSTTYHVKGLRLTFEGTTPYMVCVSDDDYNIYVNKLVKDKDNKDIWSSLGSVGKNYAEGLAITVKNKIPYVAYQESRDNSGKCFAYVNGAWTPAATTDQFEKTGQYPKFTEFYQGTDKIYIFYRRSNNSRGTIKQIAGK